MTDGRIRTCHDCRMMEPWTACSSKQKKMSGDPKESNNCYYNHAPVIIIIIIYTYSTIRLSYLPGHACSIWRTPALRPAMELTDGRRGAVYGPGPGMARQVDSVLSCRSRPRRCRAGPAAWLFTAYTRCTNCSDPVGWVIGGRSVGHRFCCARPRTPSARTLFEVLQL